MAQMNPVVYKSLNQVLRILKLHQDVPEVSALLKLCSERGLVNDAFDSIKPSCNEAKFPFLVIEGLDGAGKTTLTRFLSSKLNMKLMSTPPKNYEAFMNSRDYFDSQTESIRRAYYSLGNYLAALDVISTVDTQAVVMDRFWHSTAAYALTHQLKARENGDPSDYFWPTDLLKPDLVIFLQVSETERLRRHSSRKDFTNTAEEKILAESIDFRQNLVQCYRSIKGPPVTELIIDGKQDESENKILKTVIEAFPHLQRKNQAIV